MINYIYIVMEEMPLCYGFFSLPLIKLGLFSFTAIMLSYFMKIYLHLGNCDVITHKCHGISVINERYYYS